MPHERRPVNATGATGATGAIGAIGAGERRLATAPVAVPAAAFMAQVCCREHYRSRRAASRHGARGGAGGGVHGPGLLS